LWLHGHIRLNTKHFKQCCWVLNKCNMITGLWQYKYARNSLYHQHHTLNVSIRWFLHALIRCLITQSAVRQMQRIFQNEFSTDWQSTSSLISIIFSFSSRSSSSCLCLLHSIPVPSVFPSIFPSLMCFRMQSLLKIDQYSWPSFVLLYVWLFSSLTLCCTSLYFSHGTPWSSWLWHCITSRKVAGSIPGDVTEILHWYNPSGRTMPLGSTQLVTEKSTRNISWEVKAIGA
jgi:hypothetical protein